MHTFACSIHMPELSRYKIKINHHTSSNPCLVSPHPNFKAHPVWDKRTDNEITWEMQGEYWGVKIGKLGSSSQLLPLPLLDCAHFLVQLPPGFQNLHVAPSPEGTDCPPNSYPYIVTGQEIQSPVCPLPNTGNLEFKETTTIQLALKLNQCPTICRLGSRNHLTIGWLLGWRHKGQTMLWLEVLSGSFWTSWKVFYYLCVHVKKSVHVQSEQERSWLKSILLSVWLLCLSHYLGCFGQKWHGERRWQWGQLWIPNELWGPHKSLQLNVFRDGPNSVGHLVEVFGYDLDPRPTDVQAQEVGGLPTFPSLPLPGSRQNQNQVLWLVRASDRGPPRWEAPHFKTSEKLKVCWTERESSYRDKISFTHPEWLSFPNYCPWSVWRQLSHCLFGLLEALRIFPTKHNRGSLLPTLAQAKI